MIPAQPIRLLSSNLSVNQRALFSAHAYAAHCAYVCTGTRGEDVDSASVAVCGECGAVSGSMDRSVSFGVGCFGVIAAEGRKGNTLDARAQDRLRTALSAVASCVGRKEVPLLHKESVPFGLWGTRRVTVAKRDEAVLCAAEHTRLGGRTFTGTPLYVLEHR